MNILRLTAAAAALFVLGLGQTTSATSGDPDIGNGPLHLSPAIADLYEKYKKEFIPYYFVVSTDGRWGNYVYCDNACRPFGARTQALSGCAAYSRGVPCKIFARRVDIVWQGQVTGLYNPETGSYDPRQSDNRIIALGLTLPQLIERAEHSTFAQLELGKTFEDGRVVPKDLQLAQHWYMKAAIAGYKLAQYKIGWMYEEGLGGLPKDVAQAIYWYRQARSITGATNALARLEPDSETETETALLASPTEANLVVTDEEILNNAEIRSLIRRYYHSKKIRQKNITGRSRLSRMEKINMIRIAQIVGNKIMLDVNYSWRWDLHIPNEGTDSAVVVLEKSGSSYKVLKFETGGYAY